MGYKPVKTFNADVLDESKYVSEADAGYYKYADGEYEKVDSIKSRDSFAEALTKNDLYVKICKENEGKLEARGQMEGYDPEKGITTLSEYFHWLKELSGISTIDNPTYGRRFTRLPLDEPYFDINTNDRSIAVPAGFKKNGIAVQGDDLAEVVYFKVDRYYDYMDLANCEIAIQWETPRGKNAKGEQVEVHTSISEPYLVDVESEPGQLIFGWAISDILTSVSGTIKFSVRFYQLDEKGQIAYNFNTLTATASVKTGLYIDIVNLNPDDIDDVGDRLLERIESSQLVEGGYIAAVPVFIIDLVEGDYDLNEDDQYPLSVQAEASDTGMIVYNWKRKDLANGNITELVSSYVYEKVENPIKNDYYFIQTDENGYKWLKLTNELYNTYADKAYNRVSRCVANTAGIYYAEAENRITNSSNSSVSAEVKFPLPEEPKIVSDLIINAIIKENDEDTGIYYDENMNEQVAEKSITLELKAEEIANNVPTYQWEESEDKTEWHNVVENGTDLSYEISSPGYYRMAMTNTRNTITTDIKYSNICRVFYVPHEVELEPISNELKTISVNALDDNNCPTVEIADNGIDTDGYLVTWYVYEQVGEKVYDEPIVSMNLGKEDRICKFNPVDYAEEIHNATNDANILAEYYAKVHNRLNGIYSEPVRTDGEFRIYRPIEQTQNLSLEDELFADD